MGKPTVMQEVRQLYCIYKIQLREDVYKRQVYNEENIKLKPHAAYALKIVKNT